MQRINTVVNEVKEDILERFLSSTISQERDSVAGGSGFIISEDGYIPLTDMWSRCWWNLGDINRPTWIDAKLIGEDEASDVALLKVDAKIFLSLPRKSETSHT